MTVRLDNKVVFITGASAGIGAGTAKVMAQRGASIACLSRRAHQAREVGAEIEESGGQFLYVQGDVVSAKDCDAAVDATLERFGRLDVLINNAANPLPMQRVDEITEDGWRKVLGPTLDGVMNMSRAALKPMRARNEGVILTISSIAGEQALARHAAYGAAKAAVAQLMRAITVENFGTGIRANTIVIGGAYPTEMAGNVVDMGRMIRGADWLPDPNHDPGMLAKAMVDPESIGRALAVLCSDDAREINGSTIALDRGFLAGLLTSTALYLGAAQLLPG